MSEDKFNFIWCNRKNIIILHRVWETKSYASLAQLARARDL